MISLMQKDKRREKSEGRDGDNFTIGFFIMAVIIFGYIIRLLVILALILPINCSYFAMSYYLSKNIEIEIRTS